MEAGMSESERYGCFFVSCMVTVTTSIGTGSFYLGVAAGLSLQTICAVADIIVRAVKDNKP